MTDKAIEEACDAFLNADSIHLWTNIKAAIAAYEQAMWRPIESAPKDCRVWLWEKGEMVLADSVTAYNNYIWRRVGGSAHNFIVENPTLWRPLPPPPGDVP